VGIRFAAPIDDCDRSITGVQCRSTPKRSQHSMAAEESRERLVTRGGGNDRKIESNELADFRASKEMRSLTKCVVTRSRSIRGGTDIYRARPAVTERCKPQLERLPQKGRAENRPISTGWVMNFLSTPSPKARPRQNPNSLVTEQLFDLKRTSGNHHQASACTCPGLTTLPISRERRVRNGNSSFNRA